MNIVKNQTRSKNVATSILKPYLVAFALATVVTVIQVYLAGGLNLKGLINAIGTFSVTLSLAFLFKWMKWKVLFLIPAVAALDIDHFLFGSAGFYEHPEERTIILHAFHSIEMVVFVFLLNIIFGRHLLGKGLRTWLFPTGEGYTSSWGYYFAWVSRIILLGMAIHYFMDIFIYTAGNKWGFYDYSVIHYLFFR